MDKETKLLAERDLIAKRKSKQESRLQEIDALLKK